MLLGLGTSLVEIHEHGDKRGLTVGGHKSYNLVLDGLNATTNLVAQTLLHNLMHLLLGSAHAKLFELASHLTTDLLAAHLDERRQMRQRDGLSAILRRRNLSDDLRGDVACRRETMRLLDKRTRDNRAVLQHVLKVHQVAVVHMLSKVIRVVEVDDALVMSGHDIGRQQDALGQILGNLASHVVALNRIDGGVLVGVLLLDLFVVALDERENLVVGSVLGTLETLHIAVDDVAASHLVAVETHNLILDHILNLFDRNGVAGVLAGIGNVLRGIDNLALGQAIGLLDLTVRRSNRAADLLDVKRNFHSAALDDLHEARTSRPLLQGARTSRASPAFLRLLYSLKDFTLACGQIPALPIGRQRKCRSVLGKREVISYGASIPIIRQVTHPI